VRVGLEVGTTETAGSEAVTDGGPGTYADGRLSGLDAHLPDGAGGYSRRSRRATSASSATRPNS
jgi:hypothetical protein